MTTPALISIIIPCYKQAHFLSEAIESALAQTYPHVEIIVVDDGSPDNASEVAARYPQVRCVWQENAGLPAARNTGMRDSSGEYLVFLDSDDRLYPRALEINLKHLAQRPDCAFVSGQHFLMSEDGTPIQRTTQLQVERDHYLMLLQGNFIGCPATVMYRRSMLEAAGGFDISMKSIEDYKIYLELARKYPIFNHQELIAQYRIHGTSMSANPGRMLEYAIRAHESQWEHIKDNQQLARAYRYGLKRAKRMYHSELLVEQSRNHARAGQWSQSLSKMFALIFNYPLTFAQHALRKLRRVVFGPQSEDPSIAARSSVNEK